MKVSMSLALKFGVAVALAAMVSSLGGQPEQKLPAAVIDGTGLGWKELGEADFVNVNCKPDSWTWKPTVLYCKGNCLGGYRTKKQYTNFEMVAQWRHLKKAGNSGIFVWAPEDVLKALKPDQLPQGIEVQVLDHGYTEQYEKETKKKADWFTTNGDIFPVGVASMKPFPPISPDGSRSFPRKNLSKGVGEWNHYYIRAINGEIRLWVNGEEVSGGSECKPAKGYLVLECEGAPIEYRQIRVRELP